jgi:hypothetical protein
MQDDLITDEAVEAAARGVLESELWLGAWAKANETERNYAIYKGRAALTAALPLIRAGVVEECAKVAEDHDDPNPFPTRQRAIAAAIRALGERRCVRSL